MILPAHQRPDSSLACLPEGPGVGSLVVNIHAQGQWACWKTPWSVADCLLRPGMLAFSGPADQWLACLPSEGPAHGPKPCRHLGAHLPMLVPAAREDGVVVIDYDARQALFVQRLVRATALDPRSWPVATLQSRRQWASDLLAAGRFRRARVVGQDKHYPLPQPTVDIAKAAAWLEGVALRAWMDEDYAHTLPGVDPPGFVFPLHAPDWTLLDAFHGDLESAVALMGPRLHPGELQAWVAWSQAALPRGDRDRFVAGLLEHRLERELPQAGADPGLGRAARL